LKASARTWNFEPASIEQPQVGEPLGIVLEVGDRSDVGIWQRDESRWIDILPWTKSNAVHLATEPKELLVTTQGSGLPFVVNGVRSRQHHLQRSACRR